jgi:hypothetical protein
MASATESRIPVSKATRKKVKALKRAGETYDSLLRKMARQYDPDAVSQSSDVGETANTQG